MFDSEDYDKNFFGPKPIWSFPTTEISLIAPLPKHNDFSNWGHKRFPRMELIVSLVILFAVLICVGLICRCCCRKSRGRVLAPAPVTRTDGGPAPYPQQQYNPATYPTTTVTVYPTNSPAPYPTPVPYPTGAPMPYPPGAPYPTNVPAPYPTGVAAPYPTGAAAPYPTMTPYGHGPNAPDPNACPPSYEQVMGHEKQLPYNPNVPH